MFSTLKKYSESNLNGSNDETVAFIPIRAGSKGIPQKNIKSFCGRPLVYWVAKAASACEAIDKVYVATDDAHYREVVESFHLPKVVVISRSEESCRDEASTEIAMLEFANQYTFKDIILIQATSPLLEARDIFEGILKYKENQSDSLVSVVRQKRFIWEDNEQGGGAVSRNYDPFNRPRRQDWSGYFVENGAFYITSRARLLESGSRISGTISLYEMDEATYFEIDDQHDWLIAEQLKVERSGIDYSRNLKGINLLITDVDGVLTDAGMYYSSDGQELKKFNTRDGKGIELIKQGGIKVMLLTSENIELVKRRGEKIKADYIYMGIKDKKGFLDQFFQEHSEFSFNQTAYIGDDVNDLECIQAVKFSATPKDGHREVVKYAQYVCHTEGGRGCVREVCDLLLGSMRG